MAQITDDGIGFDLHKVQRDYDTRGSLGLLNIQERAQRIEGSLHIDSLPGEGTTITIVLPHEKDGHPETIKAAAVHTQLADKYIDFV